MIDVRPIRIEGPLVFGDKRQIDEVKRFEKDTERAATLCGECEGEGQIICPACTGSGEKRS